MDGESAAELKSEADTLKKVHRMTSRAETRILVAARPTRPAFKAALAGDELGLLKHRRKLLRGFIYSVVSLVMGIGLLPELLLSSSLQGFLHYRSASFQSVFAVAFGHYAVQAWEDFGCSYNLGWTNEELAALAVWPFGRCLQPTYVLATTYFLYDLVCLTALASAMFSSSLPSLGIIFLFLEATSAPLFWREIDVAANGIPEWLEFMNKVNRFWWSTLISWITVRLPLSVYLVLSAVDVPGLTIQLDSAGRGTLVALSVLMALSNFRFLVALVYMAKSDKFAIRREDEERARKKAAAARAWTGSSQYWVIKAVKKLRSKTSNDLDERPREFNTAIPPGGDVEPAAIGSDEEDLTREIPLRLCYVDELPPVPKEKDVGITNSVTVSSSPPLAEEDIRCPLW